MINKFPNKSFLNILKKEAPRGGLDPNISKILQEKLKYVMF